MQKHRLDLGELDLDSFEVHPSGASSPFPGETEDGAMVTPIIPVTIGISLAVCSN